MGLNKLDLTGNPLTTIIQFNIRMKNLDEVIVDNCTNLSGVEFCKLGEIRGLQLVSAKSCGIKTLPDLSEFYNVEVLDLTDNLLERLPKTIAKMRHLETLKLANNKLIVLPENCGQSIRELYLSNNSLHEFPILWLRHNLNILKLDHNLLEELPEGITKKPFNDFADWRALS